MRQVGLKEIYSLWRERPSDHVWIDVRQPEEWAEGTIPGVERIQLGQLPQALAQLDPSKTYVCVCRSGGRSGRACQILAAAGFSKLINFEGGMLSWYAARYPMA
ncbi:MAG: rhodanese [Candidatus Melainabacteria bacterium HGW-Melainabacteria-1]|nr:MAG: rhodanese [Candidatus Melainabacteria bacterium HGW-Melainabacteria-1]